MKKIKITAKPRANKGKSASKLLRKELRVPCVLYGGEGNILFSILEKDFKPLVYTKDAYQIELEISGNTFQSIIQEVQFHPVSDNIIHADFYEVRENKMIAMNIPVELLGRAPGVIAGGSLSFIMRKIRVKAMPKDMPEIIKVDISQLNIGSKVYITEMANEKYEFLHPENSVIVAVKTSRVAITTSEQEEQEDEKDEKEEEAVEEKPQDA